MAATRHVPLMVICLLLFSGSTSQPTTKRAPGVNRTRPEAIVLPSDDYYDNEDEVATVPTKTISSNGGTSKRCDYNPCEEDQPTCFELSVINDCLCPGSTSHLVAPQPPVLKTVTWNGSDVVLRWCAPHSFVKGYRVTVGGSERQRFGKERRSGGAGLVESVSEVCVAALNDAGESEGSCMMYRPKERSVALKAGLIGGALGLLLLVLLAVLLWRRRQQRKRQNGIPMGGAAQT
ncbi:leucine-rich repeat neuronal protein 4 [Hippocampus comes]|nr:PREDICTED: leucine-rich repeat neuronal protein 4-like [Hippocampus comes]